GMQDIYQVVFPGSQLHHVIVRGVVADAGDEPVKARIMLMDEMGEEMVGVYNTNDKTGRYIMVLQPGMRYGMTVEAPGFISQRSELVAKATDLDGREMPLDIIMVRDGMSAERLTPHE
ncbi:MAG TPA: carboxypeptidase-like regulatory domain-containing protein, partial [Flavobacteriales bacterium]|nr:carboxypeptidase-like regulatory domain-containing protein [Flavobacteriales bacterium]